LCTFAARGKEDPRLLVGMETSDDAGVYKLNEETALIQTVDFFTPVVDDPYDFGAIAAANALSDVYAMGGVPLTAMNIVAFPLDILPGSVLAEILRGGADKIAETGAVLLGGHSVQDKEPKYGLAVTGVAHPAEIWTNAGARPGDELILTKPLGIGIITTAMRKKKDCEGNLVLQEVVPPSVAQKAVAVMASLNKTAAEVAKEVGVNACTDITGFGLLGHAWEMAVASQVRIELNLQAIPVIAGARNWRSKVILPEGTGRI
jgi:selenide,water dikinase